MSLLPQDIKKQLEELGVSEAKNLLIDWVLDTNDETYRRAALEVLGSIDEGKDFSFFEQLFLSDEDLEIRLTSGQILKENYHEHKKIEILLEFTLTRILFLEQKLFALKFLYELDTYPSRKILLDFLENTIEKKYPTKRGEFPEEVFSHDYSQQISELLLHICYNLIIFDYYLNRFGFFATIRNGFIVSLNTDGADLGSIRKIRALEYLDQLEYLSLKRNLIEKIEGLNHLKKLKNLDLSANYITKVENLQDLEALEVLNLSYNRIKQIENLGALRKLQDLNISRNEITEIKNLENLYNIKKLTLSYNKIEKISGLYELVNLSLLHLNDNLIVEIKGLDRLIELHSLNLTNNKIEKISNLDNLLNLRKLELSRNKIQKIEGLDNLKNLQELFLDSNLIQQFEGMDNLDNLIILFLNNNKISHLTVDHWKHFKNLNFLFLNDNPLSEEGKDAYQKWTRFP